MQLIHFNTLFLQFESVRAIIPLYVLRLYLYLWLGFFSLLPHKLEPFGCPISILWSLKNYFSNRTRRTEFGYHLYSPLTNSPNVRQLATLLPHLFTIYPRNLFADPSVWPRTYADSVMFCESISNQSDFASLSTHFFKVSSSPYYV